MAWGSRWAGVLHVPSSVTKGFVSGSRHLGKQEKELCWSYSGFPASCFVSKFGMWFLYVCLTKGVKWMIFPFHFPAALHSCSSAWAGWAIPYELWRQQQPVSCIFVSQQSLSIEKTQTFCLHNVIRTILLLWPLGVVLWDGLLSGEVGAAWCSLLCSLAGLWRSLLGWKHVAVSSLRWPQPSHLWSFLAGFIEDYELWLSCTVGCCSDHLCCCKRRIWNKQAN